MDNKNESWKGKKTKSRGILTMPIHVSLSETGDSVQKTEAQPRHDAKTRHSGHEKKKS
jgi:hypothetical protein